MKIYINLNKFSELIVKRAIDKKIVDSKQEVIKLSLSLLNNKYQLVNKSDKSYSKNKLKSNNILTEEKALGQKLDYFD